MRQRDNLYYWGIRVVCASDGEEGGGMEEEEGVMQ